MPGDPSTRSILFRRLPDSIASGPGLAREERRCCGFQSYLFSYFWSYWGRLAASTVPAAPGAYRMGRMMPSLPNATPIKRECWKQETDL